MRRYKLIALEGLFTIGLPLAIYHALAPVAGDADALIVATVPPLSWSLFRILTRRTFDPLSALVLVGLLFSLLAVAAGGSARVLQLREHLVSAVIGLLFLGSVVIGKPLVNDLAAASMTYRSSKARAEFAALRDRPQFQRVMRVMTLVWGVGLIAASAIACALVFVLSIPNMMIAGPIVSYGTFSALALWTAWYRRAAERRGRAAAQAGETARGAG